MDISKSKEILDVLKREVANNPQYADLHYGLGILLAFHGDYQQAMDELNLSMSINPMFDHARIICGELSNWIFTKQDISIVHQNPPVWFSEVYVLIALYYSRFGNIEQAEEYLFNSFEINHDEAMYQMNCGLLYESRGLINQAIQSLTHSVKLGVESWKPYYVLSQLYSLVDDLPAAQDILVKGIEKYPQYPDLHYNLALLLRDLDKLPEAQQSLEKALKINPNFLFAHYHYGQVLTQLGDSTKAEQEFIKTVELGLESTQIYCDIARVQLLNGKTDAAKAYLQKAIELDATNPEPYRVLESIYQQSGDQVQAKYYADEAEKREGKPAVTP